MSRGQVRGNKGRGRPRQSFMNGLTLATGMDSSTLLHKTQNRNGFRKRPGRQRQSLTRYTKKKKKIYICTFSLFCG